jgi:hypothetical protein
MNVRSIFFSCRVFLCFMHAVSKANTSIGLRWFISLGKNALKSYLTILMSGQKYIFKKHY